MELLIVLILAFVVGGPILGLIAFARLGSMRKRLDELEQEVVDLRLQVNQRAWQPLSDEKSKPATEEKPEYTAEEETEFSAADSDEEYELANEQQDIQEQEGLTQEEPVSAAARATDYSTPPPQSVTAPPPPLPPPPPDFTEVPKPDRNLEMMLGTKWLNWVGALFIMLFVGYGLKYSYDNAWIGPKGRLAIGTIFGMVAIGLGEHFRRKNWSIIFQTLTGTGIATFYACVFFSFQIYQLSSPATAFGLAICITALAVLLAVLHNSVSIAILGVIGGFLSPVLLSTGENHPYVLFTYILILNLVAMAAAYFRRWHALDLLCFAGTVLMLGGWHGKFGHLDGQLTPALIFTTIFYLVFLLIPTLHTLVRRLPGTREGTVLVVGNALFSAAMFYRLLYPEHSHILGFVILGQAAAMFLLFRTWVHRAGSTNITAHSLLILALCLTVAAVPLHLSRFGLAIVWALQGALLTYLGLRYASIWTRGIGLAALLLATLSLLKHLPLHSYTFLPVFNMAFGSWLLVAGAALVVAWITYKRCSEEDESCFPMSLTACIIGFGLLWLLPALENDAYWRHNYTGHHRSSNSIGTLLVIWSAMCAGLLWFMQRRAGLSEYWQFVPGLGIALTLMVFLASLGSYESYSTLLVFNAAFLTRLVFVALLLYAAKISTANGRIEMNQTLESMAHIALVLLAAVELSRWGNARPGVSDRIAFSMVSLVWGLHAFALIWFGLRTRRRFRRILGFVLFALVILKVLIVDTSELEKVYRILSFGGTGLLLMGAGYFFQKYSAALLAEGDADEEQTNADI